MKRLIVVLILALLSGLGSAAHITDKLVVGLYADEKMTGEPSQLLTSGTPVEVLKQGKGVVQVRLADDTRGWLEARYVSEEKPAAMKLLEVQAELRRLKARIREGGATEDAAPVRALPSVEQVHAGLALNEAKARIAELEAIQADLPRLREAVRERDELRAQLEEIRAVLGIPGGAPTTATEVTTSLWDRYLPWMLAGLMGLIGFAAGVGFIDYRIRKRYGGFRLK